MAISERHGLWTITRLELKHNHSLSLNGRFFRAHKNMIEQEKKLIRTLNECNIPTKKMMYLLAQIGSRNSFLQLNGLAQNPRWEAVHIVVEDLASKFP